MALEFFPHIGCPIQSGREPSSFMQKAKLRSAIEMVEKDREQFSGKGTDLEQAQVTLPFAIDVKGAEPTADVTVAQIRSAWNEVEQAAAKHCANCPVNIYEELLGCYGAINYPISAEAEAWLMQQFNPPEGEAGYVAHHISETGVTGENLDAGRPAPGEDPWGGGTGPPKLFVSEAAVKKKLTPDGAEFTSSQLFEYIIFCQPIVIPITLFGLCVDFGAVRIKEREYANINGLLAIEGIAGEDAVIEKAGENWKAKATEEVPFVLEPGPDDDPGIGQLKGFFYACWLAFRTGTQLAIDG